MVRLLLAALVVLAIGTARPASAEEPGTESISVFGEKTLKIPAAWQRTRPQSSIVEHEFLIKAADADDAPAARITFMAAGGDVQANIDRWKTQFIGGDPAKQKTEQLKVGDWTVHIVDLSGKFKETVGGGPFSGGKVVERENYGMLGGILVHPEGRKYFIKVTGPVDLVKAQRESMIRMFDALKD